MVHAVEIGALRNDAQVLVHGQNLGRTCPEDRLRIGKDNLIHDESPILPGISAQQPAASQSPLVERRKRLEFHQLVLPQVTISAEWQKILELA
jgi:hypothetical protein